MFHLVAHGFLAHLNSNSGGSTCHLPLPVQDNGRGGPGSREHPFGYIAGLIGLKPPAPPKDGPWAEQISKAKNSRISPPDVRKAPRWSSFQNWSISKLRLR